MPHTEQDLHRALNYTFDAEGSMGYLIKMGLQFLGRHVDYFTEIKDFDFEEHKEKVPYTVPDDDGVGKEQWHAYFNLDHKVICITYQIDNGEHGKSPQLFLLGCLGTQKRQICMNRNTYVGTDMPQDVTDPALLALREHLKM